MRKYTRGWLGLAVPLGSLMLAVAGSPTAHAAAPLVLVQPVQFSFVDGGLSDACGTPVTVTGSGTLTSRDFTSGPSGLVTHEIDTGTVTFTFSAPSGRSVTTRSPQVVSFDFGSGAVLGSSGTATFLGPPFYNIPGARATAGRLTFAGTVNGFFPNGAPSLAIGGEPIGQHGSFPDDLNTAVFCSRLA